MRKLLNTLFVTSEDAYLTLETENVAVYIREEKKAQYPLLVLESIISFSYKGASPALMGACARQGIQLTFLTPRGRFLARVCGQEQGNVLLRKEQYRRSDDLEKSCRIAQCLQQMDQKSLQKLWRCSDKLAEKSFAMLQQMDGRILVTKDTGRAGGFGEKAAAAQSAGAKLLVIRRPTRETGLGLEELLEKLTGGMER